MLRARDLAEGRAADLEQPLAHPDDLDAARVDRMAEVEAEPLHTSTNLAARGRSSLPSSGARPSSRRF
jgi:hypothetical protein